MKSIPEALQVILSMPPDIMYLNLTSIALVIGAIAICLKNIVDCLIHKEQRNWPASFWRHVMIPLSVPVFFVGVTIYSNQFIN